ncbi:cyclin-dependent protein kinase inhibitor SMR2 isoform X2 [Malania oleifera]|uniref:cyclin-dependent protein kinase inhibitor SMR2 isoform X2 n=1 Tax=Malania oleifera TaxID=397392 RepID=UPI0025AE135A|nr:cyclin-dependent protein kinase inhibitor SMR2 isoform X2 [Malania oleifera]
MSKYPMTQQNSPEKEKLQGSMAEEGGRDEKIHDQSSKHDNSYDCRTPASEDHKIPTSTICPPPPRKRLRKRKLPASPQLPKSQLKPEEIEEFFKSVMEPSEVTSPAVKKRKYKKS